MLKKKNCGDCGKEFEYKPSRFNRKYCDKCSAERKKAWDERWKIEFDDKNNVD